MHSVLWDRWIPTLMGGRISAHGNLHGVFLSVIVFHDRDYEKTRDIMNTLQELCGGEIQYHEYWVSKGFIPHSQASLENIDESKIVFEWFKKQEKEAKT